ncbi:MAG: sodium:solute symporter family protein [Elusimicrobiota bacterium]
MPFAAVDWAIIIGYLLVTMITGLLVSRQASRGLASYFIADRSLPWWWLGTSMVATTFAADTPLAITGIVAKNGIAGNWFWWCWIFSNVAMTVFFAARWRRSRVMTDAELIELRYDGKPAAFLRSFKALFLAIVINCIILGWVFRAMSKIADPFIRWEALLPAGAFTALVSGWPSWLVFDNPNNTMTVLVIFTLVVIYSGFGGIRGVILTDLLQFGMAVAGSVTFAVLAVSYVGGIDGLLGRLHSQYPDAGEILSFTPSLDAVWLPFQVFLVFVLVQWWAKHDADGTGYLAQRILTAKTPRDAVRGSLWYTVANFAIRTWPWILVGLAALVVFPKGDETAIFKEGAAVAADREMGYPILMKLILPPGVLGLLFASLLAAFMSTVDTHLNWGASYLVNDVYKRFLRPKASQKELVAAGRMSLVLLAVAAILIASQISSIEKAWKFVIALTAGMGLPTMLRWVWWRINAWSEIAGMSSAILTAAVLYTLYPNARAEYILLGIVGVSTLCCLAATYWAPETSKKRLKAFYKLIEPVGFWGDYADQERRTENGFYRLGGAWVLGCAGTFAAMFGVGHLCLARPLLGIVMLAASGLLLRWTLKLAETGVST